ncbi:MAG: ThuA domain-containing protein [Propionibacteriaceae bacterium]|jgi:type 1 glutamine amidotransferase
MLDALIISGSGLYADSWHPFPITSARIADIINGIGYSVDVTEDVEERLRDPGDCRLLVINIGNPAQPRPADVIEQACAGLESHLNAGGGLLGMHSSITSLTTMPAWRRILGGRWIRGHSMHPAKGPATILLANTEHPITAGLADLVVIDERYSFLETEPDITVLYEHDHEGLRHPLVWTRQNDQARVVYDGLGHDAASYDSLGHQTLLCRSVRWLLGDS